MPQHKDETCLSVTAAKAEKNDCMTYGASLSVMKWAISSQTLNRGRFND